MIFKDIEHENNYHNYFLNMCSGDEYHKSAAYLLALSETIRSHVNSVFDFSADVIKPECLQAAWQTGTSAKICRLLFNLWNGYDSEGEPTEDEPHSANYTPESIFCTSDLPYLLEAVKIRFSIYA